MKDIAKGDRVKFLNDTGAGVVTEIVDNEIVKVSTDDGFEYPVMKKELILSTLDSDGMQDSDKETVMDDSEFRRKLEAADYENDRVDTELDEAGDEKSSEAVSAEDKPLLTEKYIQSVDRESKFYKKAMKIKEREEAKKKEKTPGIEEVDLHIGEILDDYSYLNSGEIVNIQISRFRTSLEGAIRARQKKIVFIHGKGAGKLKRDIQRIIDAEFPDFRYQDASFREYGYGATIIYLK